MMRTLRYPSFSLFLSFLLCFVCLSHCSGPPELVCERDDQCGANKVCQNGGCVDGECSQSRSCPAGQVCKGAKCSSCTQDQECGKEQVCEKGACLKACSEANPCKDGQVCQDKRCKDCPDDQACGQGSICESGRCKAGCRADDGCQDNKICEQSQCVAPGCSADKPCPSGKICNKGRCSDCSDDASCTSNTICEGGSCVEGCRDDKGCTQGQRCDTQSKKCVACLENAHCGAGEVCRKNACSPCAVDTECGQGKLCQQGKCIDGNCRAEKDCQNGQICKNNQCSACTDDKECADGQICEQQQCQAGCRKSEDCRSGQVCDTTNNKCTGCLQNKDCLGGLVCLNNTCSPCQDDAACGQGLLCLNSACVQADCRQTSECKDGKVCRKNVCSPCSVKQECATGQICVEGACKKGDCLSTADCKDGKVCKANVCEVCTDDKECAAGQLCLSGACKAGYCRTRTGCKTGLICQNNRCTTCSQDSECDTGELCLRGLCFKANCRTRADCQQSGQICRNNQCETCQNDRDCEVGELCLSGSCKKGDCRTTNDCPQGKLCLSNTCSTCANDSECGAGNLCISGLCQQGNCRQDADCSGGKLCKNNTCAACASDSECGAGKLCLGGSCTTGNCRSFSDCQNGQVCTKNVCSACSTDSECPAGQLCLSGVCKVGNCRQNSDCSGGQACIKNVCGACSQDAECGAGFQCVKGVCLRGVVVNNGAFEWSDGKVAKDCLEYLKPPASYAPATQDGLYWINPDAQTKFKVRCNMMHSGGGWILVASFINGDGTNRWTRPTGDGNWRNTSTFGTPETYDTTDYKGPGWTRLKVTDVMLTDESGGWLSYKSVLNGVTLQAQFSAITGCQQAPLVLPGDPRVDSSSTLYKQSAMLAFYAGDPNLSNRCSYSTSHNDSTILAIGGHGCGTIGAGQWGTNYNNGMDWHANLSNATVCTACDTCGPWYGHRVVTSKDHSNNKGVHDGSTKGYLWVRNTSVSGLGSSSAKAASSCLEIKNLGGVSKDGVYWIDLDGPGTAAPVQLYCDMTRDGGGWTLVGQINVQQSISKDWLRNNVRENLLQSPAISADTWASVNAVYMAVHHATEVRFSNQAIDRWVKWQMTPGRTLTTWWNHAEGYTKIRAATEVAVIVRAYNGGTSNCYQNIYGIQPLQQHGGSYPSAHYNTNGNTVPNDWCMATGVMPTGTPTTDGFSQNGNGYDAPFSETGWPNSNYTSKPYISVWLR